MDSTDPSSSITQPVVIFDGDCAFCTSSVTWLAARLSRGRDADPRLAPWQAIDLTSYGTTIERARREVLWVAPDGSICGGADAIAAWMRYRGGPYGALGWAMSQPPACWVAAAVYRLVARHRQRLPGGTPACALPSVATPRG